MGRSKISNKRAANSLVLQIITPVYNEAESFPKLYKEIKQKVKTPFKLIVVYDFDEDTTVPVASKIAKKDKSVILHKNTIGRGALNALKSGFDYVQEGPLLVTMADLSDDMTSVDLMYQKFIEGADIVCGSRYMKGGQQIGGPLFKRSLSRLAGISLFWVRRVPTHDITNNFKLYDKGVINSLVIESEGGFEIGMEITVKAFRKGYQIQEVPTKWKDRTSGEAKFKLWKWLPSYIHWYIRAFGPVRKETINKT